MLLKTIFEFWSAMRGQSSTAVSLPHDFPADLVLLRLEDSQPDLNFKIELTQQKSEKLYVVAFDQGRNGPRIYTPGEFAHYPDTAALPQARIHTDARALPETAAVRSWMNMVGCWVS